MIIPSKYLRAVELAREVVWRLDGIAPPESDALFFDAVDGDGVGAEYFHTGAYRTTTKVAANGAESVFLTMPLERRGRWVGATAATPKEAVAKVNGLLAIHKRVQS